MVGHERISESYDSLYRKLEKYQLAIITLYKKL